MVFSEERTTSSQQILQDIVLCLEEGKASDIVVLNVRGKSPIADDMVVASGGSNRHVAALAHKLAEKLKLWGVRPLRQEGLPQCDWVLIDTGDILVHIFRPEVRDFYTIEKLWSPKIPDPPTSE